MTTNETVNPSIAILNGFTVSPGEVIGGRSGVNGTVTLVAAVSTDTTITFGGGAGVVTSPTTSVVIPAGQQSYTFPIATDVVCTSVTPYLTASLNANSYYQPLRVDPLIDSLSVANAVSHLTATGTFRLNGTAASGDTVTLTSSNPSVASVPASLDLSTGNTFPINIADDSAGTSVTITATFGSCTYTKTFTVAPLLTNLTLAPQDVVAGDPATATVTYQYGVPNGIPITLSGDPDIIPALPATINTGSCTSCYGPQASLTFTTPTTSGGTNVTIKAHYGYDSSAVDVSQVLHIHAFPYMQSVGFYIDQVTGGNSAQGSATLSDIAPQAGIVVSLTVPAEYANVLQVPATVTIPSGESSMLFPVTTFPVAADTVVPVTATYNGVSVSSNFTVRRPRLVSFTLDPQTVAGGSGINGTVQIDGNAPGNISNDGDGVFLNITVDRTDAAIMPPPVRILPGQRSAIFQIPTSTVNASVSILLTATNMVSATDAENRTASASIYLGNIHASDVFPAQPTTGANLGVKLDWNLNAFGDFIIKRDGVAIATLPNTARTYIDYGVFTSGHAYRYELLDTNFGYGDPSLLSAETTEPYMVVADQSQAVDSREDASADPGNGSTDQGDDPVPPDPAYMNVMFQTRTYRGGLYVGKAPDSSKVGRSFAEFNIGKTIPVGGIFRTAKVAAYFVTVDTDQGQSVSQTIYCKSLNDSAGNPYPWSQTDWANSLYWTASPGLTDTFTGGVAQPTATINYNQWMASPITAKASDGQVILTWMPPPPQVPADHYRVFFKLQSAPSTDYAQWGDPIPVAGTGTTSATVTGLDNDKTYTFVVAVYDVNDVFKTQSPEISILPSPYTHEPVTVSAGANYWVTFNMGDSVKATLTNPAAGTLNPYSVALEATDETNDGWLYFAKKEYKTELAPYLAHIWSLPALISVQVTPSAPGGTTGIGIVNMNAIGLDGSQVVSIWSDSSKIDLSIDPTETNPQSHTSDNPLSLTVSGLNREFYIKVPKGTANECDHIYVYYEPVGRDATMVSAEFKVRN